MERLFWVTKGRQPTFTLVEGLVVLMILGMLAWAMAAVGPGLSGG